MAEIVDFGLQKHKIKMDSRYFDNVLSVVAGDTGRRIEVQLLDTNGMVQNTTGLNLRLNAIVEGKATYTDADLVDAATGKYQLDLSNGMFLAPGNWQFQWQVTDSAGKKLHSFAFTGNVGKNISEGGSQATNFYLNLDDLKAMQEDLVNGTFDSEALETNISEKLTNLESEYAPRLSEVTAQLAQKVGGGNLATMGDIGQDVKEAMTGGSVAVVGKNTVTEENIVDKQVTPRKTTFIEDYNILNIANSIKGGFWQTAGGTWQARANLNQSEKYPYHEGDTIFFSRLSAPYGNSVIQFWDADGNYIANSSRPLQIKISVVSPNAKFFSFAYYDGEENDLKVYVNEVKKPTLKGIDISDGIKGLGLGELIGKWKGRKVIYQGDSITDPIYNANLSTQWTAYLNTNLGLIQKANYAISGSTLARNPDNPTARNPIVDRLDVMDTDADLVFNAAITNDWFYGWSPIGIMDSREPTTLYGALHLICLNYKKKYKNATIIFTTGIKRKQGTSTSPTSVNSLGKTLKEYNDILKEVCRYYSIRVLDMDVESGLFPFDDELALLDYNDQGYFTHPNANGQLKMGKAAIGYLNAITP